MRPAITDRSPSASSNRWPQPDGAKGYTLALNVGDQWSDLKGKPEAILGEVSRSYYFIRSSAWLRRVHPHSQMHGLLLFKPYGGAADSGHAYLWRRVRARLIRETRVEQLLEARFGARRAAATAQSQRSSAAVLGRDAVLAGPGWLGEPMAAQFLASGSACCRTRKSMHVPRWCSALPHHHLHVVAGDCAKAWPCAVLSAGHSGGASPGVYAVVARGAAAEQSASVGCCIRYAQDGARRIHTPAEELKLIATAARRLDVIPDSRSAGAPRSRAQRRRGA